MTTLFKPAIREQTSLLIAIAGASGSGKTYSALQLATGLAGDGKIAFIDTESGRALHYTDRFKFDHAELTAPFKPQAYAQMIDAADKAGYAVIIVDSMSHEWEGPGGVIEWADDEGRNMKPPKNWMKPKQAHKRMVQRMLQCRAHLIFCLRAEDKIKITKDAQTGKIVIIQPEEIPVQDRWVPICEKRFMYEMTVSMVMQPHAPGIPVPVKIQDQHRFAFPDGRQVSVDAGKALAQWAHGGTKKQAPVQQTTTAPVENVQNVQNVQSGQKEPIQADFPGDQEKVTAWCAEADKGLDHLRSFYKRLSSDDMNVFEDYRDRLVARAKEAAHAG